MFSIVGIIVEYLKDAYADVHRASRRIQLGSFRKYQLDDYIMMFVAVRGIP